MSRATIFIEKEVSQNDEKRIKKNLRKVRTAIDDLADMGYTMYLAPNSLNVCDGDTHKGKSAEADRGVVVASVYLEHIDAGDW